MHYSSKEIYEERVESFWPRVQIFQPPKVEFPPASLQALLEMLEVASAQSMVSYYSERPAQIRGRCVYVQFSNHDQLKTEGVAPLNGSQVSQGAHFILFFFSVFIASKTAEQ